jgi:hypothetical protein
MNEQLINFNSIFEYISENFIGLCLLILAIFIIIFVDYINQLNAIIFKIPNQPPLPGVQNSMPIRSLQNIKSKFIKRRSRKIHHR